MMYFDSLCSGRIVNHHIIRSVSEAVNRRLPLSVEQHDVIRSVFEVELECFPISHQNRQGSKWSIYHNDVLFSYYHQEENKNQMINNSGSFYSAKILLFIIVKTLIIMFVKPCDMNRIMWITSQEFSRFSSDG